MNMTQTPLKNIVIVGTCNVGKSTLFNRITNDTQAIVWDEPGVTRDRKTLETQLNNHSVHITDTGGLLDDLDAPHQAGINTQAKAALAEADIILFVLDGRCDPRPEDLWIADLCRQKNSSNTIIVVNKTDGLEPSQAIAPFYSLGFDTVMATAANQGRGVRLLITKIGAMLGHHEEEAPPLPPETASNHLKPETEDHSEPDTQERESNTLPTCLNIALVGQPNAGKSTLTNRLAKENRVLVSPEAGTTRDAIAADIQHKGRDFCIIDTAGIPRRKQNKTALSKITFLKNQTTTRTADVVVVLLDATRPLSDQDRRILNSTVRTYQPTVVALNRWDLLTAEERQKARLRFKEDLQFIWYAPYIPISATTGYGVNALMREVAHVAKAQSIQHTSSKLTRVLEQAIANHQPPCVQGRRIKLRFAHPKENHALHIVIRGKQLHALPLSYRRYLEHYFYNALNHAGSKMKIEWINDDNPYIQKNEKQS